MKKTNQINDRAKAKRIAAKRFRDRKLGGAVVQAYYKALRRRNAKPNVPDHLRKHVPMFAIDNPMFDNTITGFRTRGRK